MENKGPSNESGANEKEVESGKKEEAPPEMLTSDYYGVKNIPERFNHPGRLDLLECAMLAVADECKHASLSRVHLSAAKDALVCSVTMKVVWLSLVECQCTTPHSAPICARLTLAALLTAVTLQQ